MQSAEVMKLFDHYLELKKLHPENPLSAAFYLKPHENILKDEVALDSVECTQPIKLSGMLNRLGLFKVYLSSGAVRYIARIKRFLRC